MLLEEPPREFTLDEFERLQEYFDSRSFDREKKDLQDDELGPSESVAGERQGRVKMKDLKVSENDFHRLAGMLLAGEYAVTDIMAAVAVIFETQSSRVARQINTTFGISRETREALIAEKQRLEAQAAAAHAIVTSINQNLTEFTKLTKKVASLEATLDGIVELARAA